jgi:hypothetical protein
MKFSAGPFLLSLTVFSLVSSSFGQADEKTVDYLHDIKPILHERCFSCHGALKQESGLRLDTVQLAQQGGDSGPAVIPHDLESSLVIQRIQATDDSVRMPPEGKPLTAEQIRLLTEWIASGASAPADERPEEDPRQHWAFQKLIRPALPAVPSGVTNPIDAFLESARQSRGVKPMPEADRATLLRRVSLNLIGLPPTADELTTFLNDNSPYAWQTAVDRLLASPQHGERWGRHWMDVWRYSDWYGRRSVPDVMNSYPMVWRWRDWIVRSLNEDKPYNQMVVEMLAADELTPDDPDNVVATGYLVRSWFKWNYETWKKDLVEHTGKAFLGLTLNCAQCHDHKYDPLTQEEYFRFRAFFEPLELRHDRYPGDTDPGPFKKYVYAQSYGPINSGMVRVFDEYLDAETFMFSRGDSRLRMEGKPPVKPGAPAVLGGDQLQTAPVLLPLTAAYPGMQQFIRNEERDKIRSALAEAEQSLKQAQEKLNAEPTELRTELASAEEALRIARETALQQLTTTSADQSSVLEGTQSMVLDAEVGRRALSHSLPGLDALSDQGVVSYLVQIVKDGHTNLQLGLDIAAGATGGFVAFENGSIRTYSPGGFNEFIAGKYDLAKNQNRFRVTMQLDVPQDIFRLTVTSLSDDAVLVDSVPGAINGWKPQANGKRGLFVDCRPGTKAIYDALTFSQPEGTALLQFDFEPPAFQEGQDVVDATPIAGSAAWMATSACAAPATSRISSAVAMHPEVQTATQRLVAAQQALRLPTLRIEAAQARVVAAQANLDSLELRILADDTRYSSGQLAQDRREEPEVLALIHKAHQSERHAAVASATADQLTAEEQIAAEEVAVATATKAADQAAIEAAGKSLQAAQTKRTAAVAALAAAKTALTNEPGEYTALSPKYPQLTSGRRTVLAQWIASNDNPLTARVAVNHIWLRHFGKALVETTHDLGRNGARPAHPALLDWLACELMESGWSMKHVHRLIVTSRTYQQASMLPQSADSTAPALAASGDADPDNVTFWRFPAARMQAEVVRDSLLAVAGQLDPTMGGHEIDHKQGLTSHRRSLYFAHHGEEKMEFLELFDAANACDCYKRTSSVQPQQALALTNSELTKTLSRQLATKLWERTGETGTTEASDGAHIDRFVELAFLQVLNRPARDAERIASLEFLKQQPERLKSANPAATSFDLAARARDNLVHALMNHNDFVTIR